MNKIIIPTLAGIFLISISACKKENSAANSGATLSASKITAIKKGEPVLFTLSNSLATTVTWKVSPSLNTRVNATGNNASVMFGNGGAYTVTAATGNSIDSSVVIVTDSAYSPPVVSTILPLLSNEEIKITASKLDSAGYSGLILFAQTVNSYTCLSNSLTSQFTGNPYTINFTGVNVPADCTTGSAKAGTFEYLVPLTDGTNALSITLNGTTYTGSIVKTGSSYTINWSYTSGVTISPSTL